MNLPLPNEDEINFDLSEVTVADATTRMNLIGSQIRFNGASFDTVMANIPESEITKLYNEVKGYCTSKKGCVTALQVFYGAKDNGGTLELFPIYQSVFLKFDHYDAASETSIYKPEQYGNLYSFDGTRFNASSASELATAQSKFKSEITIKHNASSTTFEPFVDGTDIEAVLMAFQLIYHVLNDNGNTTVDMNYGMVTIQDETEYPYKMSLLNSAAKISSQGPFAGIYANRMDDSPPNPIYGVGYSLV